MSQTNLNLTIQDLYDYIYIIPGAHETNAMDKVNQTTRFKKCKSDMLSFDLSKKVGYLTNKCSGLNKTALRDPVCTYNNILQFTGKDLQDSFTGKIPFNTFWESFCRFIQNINIGMESLSQTEIGKTQNFYLATHHNRIKKTIFEKLLNKKTKTNFANCSCVKITLTSQQVAIECIFSGFPDKDGNYITKDTKIDEESNQAGDENSDKPFNKNSIIEFKKELLNTFSDILSKTNMHIYIIRHGNAFHNAPLKLGNRNPLQRPLDSCLTPLGILQAQKLGIALRNSNQIRENEHNFYCSSYMNRAQLTIVELAAGAVMPANDSIESLKNNTISKILFFRGLMRKMSLARLYRRLGANPEKWVDKMQKLAYSRAGEKTGNPDEIVKKLLKFGEVERVKKYYNSCEQYMTLPVLKIPATGKVEIKPALHINSPIVNYRVTSAAAGGGKKYTRKKKITKKTRKKKAYRRKKRTKKYALKKRHWRNLFK